MSKKQLRVALNDPGADSETLLAAAWHWSRLVREHPMMPILSLSEPDKYRGILSILDRLRANRAWKKHVRRLPLPGLRRLFVEAILRHEEKLDTLLFVHPQHRGETVRLAHLMAGVVDRQIHASTIAEIIIAVSRKSPKVKDDAIVAVRDEERENAYRKIVCALAAFLGPSAYPYDKETGHYLRKRGVRHGMLLHGIEAVLGRTMFEPEPPAETTWAARRASALARKRR